MGGIVLPLNELVRERKELKHKNTKYSTFFQFARISDYMDASNADYCISVNNF